MSPKKKRRPRESPFLENIREEKILIKKKFMSKMEPQPLCRFGKKGQKGVFFGSFFKAKYPQKKRKHGHFLFYRNGGKLILGSSTAVSRTQIPSLPPL